MGVPQKGKVKKMKEKVLQAFRNIYKNKRLLAVRLNGFNHTLFYDNGDGNSPVEIDRYSLYAEIGSDNARKLFEELSLNYHSKYKRDPKELVYIYPEER